jgi:hypothetical protein
MELYKIMLVDDEEEVRTSIIKQVDWEKLGFRVVSDAENGEDALEKIDIYEPDVIMTDIRMPYMDGLSLIEKVHSKYPTVKFLIFSGFDDFEYAKEAIRLGVSEYILKPINSEELSGIFNKIKKNLDLEIENRRDIARLRENYKTNLPIIKNQFLINLLNSKLSKAEIDLRLKEYEIDLNEALKYQAACIDIEYEKMLIDPKLGLQKELVALSVMNLLKDKIEEYYRVSVFNSLVDDRILIIIAIDEKNKNIDLIDLLRAICKESIRVLGVSISLGLGDKKNDILELSLSYQESLEAIGYKQIVGIGEAIYIKDVEPHSLGTLYFDEKEDEEFSSSIKFGPIEKINTQIDNILYKLENSKVHFRQKQAYAFSIITVIIRLMQQYEISLVKFDSGDSGYIDVINKLQNFEEFIVWLRDICIRLYTSMQEKRESNSKQVIAEAKMYIMENYDKEELSVDTVCKKLHLSTAYFSTLFKKEVGQTCIAYITDFRLKKAVELLNTTDDKTYMIANKVGYAEQNYFSYVFKKKYGVSPSKYRSNKDK